MKKTLMAAASAVSLLLVAGPALAAGELHIYNWGNYTNPKLVEKFQKDFDVKITLDDYDSNETMLSKVRAGNSGYDIVVPSDYTVKEGGPGGPRNHMRRFHGAPPAGAPADAPPPPPGS